MSADQAQGSTPPPRWSLWRGYEDYHRYVNPGVILRAELTAQPFKLMSVDGDRYVDDEGLHLDDFLSGWGTQAFGPRCAYVEDAVRQFLDSKLPGYFSSSVSPFAGLLARALFERSGQHYDRSWFASGGAEAVEAAIKMARAATGRPRILHMRHAYHGCTMGSLAMMEPGTMYDPFKPHLPSVTALRRGDIAQLERELGAGDVACVVIEPVQVEGGLWWPESDYLEALCALTKAHDVALIADEIQAGLGRCGTFLRSQRWPRRPDVVTLAKPLGGGLVPVSAMMTTQDWFTRAYGDHVRAEAHFSTFSGNALACVAGLAALEVLDDALLAHVQQLGAWFGQALKARFGAHELVVDVRGEGLLWGVELARETDRPWLSFEYLRMDELREQPALGLILCHRLYRSGFFCNVCGHDWAVLRIQPPLNVTQARLEAFMDALEEALEFVS